jgi:hypothetical protein
MDIDVGAGCGCLVVPVLVGGYSGVGVGGYNSWWARLLVGVLVLVGVTGRWGVPSGGARLAVAAGWACGFGGGVGRGGRDRSMGRW